LIRIRWKGHPRGVENSLTGDARESPGATREWSLVRVPWLHVNRNVCAPRRGAKRRLADEYDMAQDRGEVAKSGDALRKGPAFPKQNAGKATAAGAT
jgi:hypothetical protein